jgi:integrase
VLGLNEDDVLLSEVQLRVRGNGKKLRFLSLAPETVQLLDHYRRLERPPVGTAALFVSLKGPARGTRMTLAGLRSLFLRLAPAKALDSARSFFPAPGKNSAASRFKRSYCSTMIARQFFHAFAAGTTGTRPLKGVEDGTVHRETLREPRSFVHIS